MHFVAMIEDYARELSKVDLGLVLGGLVCDEAARLRKAVCAIDALHDRIVTRI